MNGQNSRSGGGVRPGFEGGQMPLLRRIPKRGFTNKFRQPYAIVSIETLNSYFESGAEITAKILKEKGIIKKDYPIKVLGNGKIKKELTIKMNAFSKSAMEKIKAAGGTVEIIKK